MASTSSEDRKIEEQAKEMAHRTKVVHFLGRTTPIILQNDNGPCPLLAICNVLLLKNQLNLSPDVAEVSQEKLLSLVAEQLIDSNSNVNNKDAGYVENQQQNIADAIDLLPRLTTGIDVNIKFRRIDDFEFTRECAVFDLLDIPLYHGWIVDPQDYETSSSIGSKSYNALTEELVALETQNMDDGDRKNAEEDDVDFVAATTAALGVPSPCLSRVRSFDDSPLSISSQQAARKGDIEEGAELLRILKLSEAEVQNSTAEAVAVNINEQNLLVSADERVYLSKSEPVNVVEILEESGSGCQKSYQPETSTSSDCNDLILCNNDLGSEIVPSEGSSFLNVDQGSPANYLASKDTRGFTACKEVNDKTSSNVIVESAISGTRGEDLLSSCERLVQIPEEDMQIQKKITLMTDRNEPETNQSDCDMLDVTTLSVPSADSDSSSGQRKNFDEPKVFTPSIDSSEPIYEGEECISRITVCEDREPMYEGEVILAEQVDKRRMDAGTNSKGEITPRQGELIRNFLKNSASQLTIYGLFCLQDGLKERELCVFFRNNHFNTMFKFEGELYILATDQGYINQPDLVWEKLNEVNGDTLYMTGNFKEFKVEDHSNNTWDEQNARDYLASVDNSEHAQANFNSDLQLAIALQQKEFEQSQCTVQQPKVTGGSRLVTGPQVPRHNIRNSSSSVKQEAKSSKDKCIIM